MDTELPILSTTSALERLDGDKDLYRGLISDFFDTEKDTVKMLKNFYRLGNYEQLRARAHRMKGVLLTLGAERLGNICMQIERMIKENRVDPPLLSQLIDALPSGYAETERELSDFATHLS